MSFEKNLEPVSNNEKHITQEVIQDKAEDQTAENTEDEKNTEGTPTEHPKATEISHDAIEVTFETKNELYSAYMPFIRDGALFIETTINFELGEDVSLIVMLKDEPAPLPVIGTVIWVTPRGAQGGMQAGVGVKLDKDAKELRSKIEAQLAGNLNSERRTNTM